MPNLDVNVRDAALMTPLMWAAFHGKPENIRVLTEYGAGKYMLLTLYTQSAHWTTIISDQSLFDVDGMTALHWSVHGNDTQALQVCK